MIHSLSRHRAPRLLAAPLILTLATGAAAASPAGAESLETAFARAGLQPLSAPPPAPDFDLPLLGGGNARLSESGGRWIVLTFWAAWCGPCRAEMPSLEAVHRQRSSAGLAVLGVALDREAAASRELAGELGLTFPSFHDGEGRVAGLYRADSIPTSYLIDPSGAVVAQARGARDWRALLPVLDAALEARPPESAAPALFASGALPVPTVSRPPTAEVELLGPAARPGRPLDLLIRLHWAGDFTEYLPQPPFVHLPDGVEQQGVTAETSSRDGRHLVTYRITLVAAEPGRFALDPIELRYTPAGSAEPVATRIAGPTVEVRPRGLAANRVAVAAGALMAVALVGLVVLRRRRSRAPGVPPRGAAYDSLRELYSAARAARLQGDAAGFLTRLAELERRLGAADGTELGELESRIEAARFGGRAPSSATMDQLQRRVERRLQAARPDPRAASRRRLRLRRTGDA